MTDLLPLSERLKGTSGRGGAAGLEVFYRRIPFYWQGVAALTGTRFQRENLSCLKRWEETYYQEREAGEKRARRRKGRKYQDFFFWMIWGGLDLVQGNDPEMLTRLLLEPMYWMEELNEPQNGEPQKL